MRTLEIGLVLPMGESFVDGATARWVEIRELARRAEEIGSIRSGRRMSCCGVRPTVKRMAGGSASR